MALLSHNVNTFVLLTGFYYSLFMYFFMEMMSKDQLYRFLSMVALNLMTSILDFAPKSVRRNLILVTAGPQ